jgi:hypothetical protein
LTTSIAENGSGTFNIYPNPADEFIKIDFSPNESYRVSIFNSIGQILYDQLIYSTESTIPIALKKGFYLVRVNNRDQSMVKKLIVE